MWMRIVIFGFVLGIVSAVCFNALWPIAATHDPEKEPWLLVATDILRYDNNLTGNFSNAEQMREFKKAAHMVSYFVMSSYLPTKLSTYSQKGWTAPMNDSFFTWVAPYNVTTTALFDMETRNVSAILASLFALPLSKVATAHVIWITDAVSSCREFTSLYALVQSGVKVYVVLTDAAYGNCFTDHTNHGIHLITPTRLVAFVDPFLKDWDEHVKMHAEWASPDRIPHMANALFYEYMHVHTQNLWKRFCFFLHTLFGNYHYPLIATRLC